MNYGVYPQGNDRAILDEYDVLPDGVNIRVAVRFGPDYIKPLFVIVEMYDHKGYGRGKREYLKQFSDKERKVISAYYSKLYGWYLRTGIPRNGVEMKMSTYKLLCRAANFFASL